jgi:hypothetical protein
MNTVSEEKCRSVEYWKGRDEFLEEHMKAFVQEHRIDRCAVNASIQAAGWSGYHSDILQGLIIAAGRGGAITR